MSKSSFYPLHEKPSMSVFAAGLMSHLLVVDIWNDLLLIITDWKKHYVSPDLPEFSGTFSNRELLVLHTVWYYQASVFQLTLPRCCSQSSLRSASWRSTWSPPPPSWRAAGGPRLSPSSSGAATTSGPWRLRRAGCSENCCRSPPRSGRPPVERGGHREAWWRGLSKAARVEQAEAVACGGV